jgi:menaquinone reductase, multiheme cytochrome c subunit
MFPRWANLLLPLLVVGFLGSALYLPTVVWLGFSPQATDVGYAPAQPVPYSHALHVGKLGFDCRYCHTTVQDAGFAAIPSVQTCMNCHSYIHVTGRDGQSNKNLEPVWDAWDATWRDRAKADGTNHYTTPPIDQDRVEGKQPIQWVKVHDLPDYSYFNHSAHTNKGIGCVSCHGRVDHMEVVYQNQPLNMAWCLDCHRQPEKFLRPVEQITNLGWTVDKIDETNPEIAKAIRADQSLTADTTITQVQMGSYLKKKLEIRDHAYMTSCSTCHR